MAPGSSTCLYVPLVLRPVVHAFLLQVESIRSKQSSGIVDVFLIGSLGNLLYCSSVPVSTQAQAAMRAHIHRLDAGDEDN